MNVLAERIARLEKADLYVVITGEFCARRSSFEVLDACLAAGVSLVQLREKHLQDRALLDLARLFREHTRAAGALLIIDDRLDIALAADADGVHLGQQDLPIAAARALAPQLLIGASTHSVAQALRAQEEGASYVNIGPIYATQTKATAVAPLGPNAVADVTAALDIPVTCMGGIKPGHIDELARHGARRIAVVTAVTAAPDVQQAAAALRGQIASARRRLA